LEYFNDDEVSEIWITFPDPQPQKSREKKRLTSDTFLDNYQRILIPGGLMHLKTDNDELYAYTYDKLTERGVPICAHTDDLYRSTIIDEVLRVKTYYERKYLALEENINYIRWTFQK